MFTEWPLSTPKETQRQAGSAYSTHKSFLLTSFPFPLLTPPSHLAPHYQYFLLITLPLYITSQHPLLHLPPPVSQTALLISFPPSSNSVPSLAIFTSLPALYASFNPRVKNGTRLVDSHSTLQGLPHAAPAARASEKKGMSSSPVVPTSNFPPLFPLPPR